MVSIRPTRRLPPPSATGSGYAWPARRWRAALDRRRAWLWRGDAPAGPDGWLGPGGELAAAGLRFGRSPLEAPAGARRFGLTASEAGQPLRLRPWREGDRLRIGPAASRSVADLLGEAGLNPLLKRRQPVLEAAGGGLLWLPGLRRAWTPDGEQRSRSTHIIWMTP